MKIAEIIHYLETLAPAAYQEHYDNAGLLTGDANQVCTGVICALDATEAVIEEAVSKGCNLVVAHHPIIFSGLKKITGKNYVERTVISSIKNNVAIYAIHTNLDNVLHGVNSRIADRLGLVDRMPLLKKQNSLCKLIVFVPQADEEKVKNAIFKAGGGAIGNYSECSFTSSGKGTFKAGEGTNPHVGKNGERHSEPESRVEVIFPIYMQQAIVGQMFEAHPYEEVAYDVIPLANLQNDVGSGLVGRLPKPMAEKDLLQFLKKQFNLELIRHTPFLNQPVQTIALCGGAGSFLTRQAIKAGAQVFITGDVKYHEFFDADNRVMIADIGHWESEQFTMDLLVDVLESKFPTFAVQKSKVQTNPVRYFT